MAAARNAQIVVDGVLISEGWGIGSWSGPDARDDWATDGKREAARKEWVQRHNEYARASGYGGWVRLSVDPKDAGHMLHEAWKERPADEGPPRWFGGD